MKKILVIGIYLLDKENNAKRLIENFSVSSKYEIKQKWASIGLEKVKEIKEVTSFHTENPLPKFEILNELIKSEDLTTYEYIIVSDDDIFIEDNFIDNYFTIVEKYNFSLSQPARTHNSYIDHCFVEQLNGIESRSTNFVEIGPLFSIKNDFFSSILPFDKEAKMGWGMDFVWPVLIRSKKLKMGIIDCITVDHSLRAPTQNYNRFIAEKEMDNYLSKHKHLNRNESFTINESFPLC